MEGVLVSCLARRNSRSVVAIAGVDGMDEGIGEDDNEPPWYDADTFRRRFRMSWNLFLRICQDLERERNYFKQRRHARGKLGFTAI